MNQGRINLDKVAECRIGLERVGLFEGFKDLFGDLGSKMAEINAGRYL